jgi:8-oxo-dGTP pyrophosphatase MutT (NUDIX family)
VTDPAGLLVDYRDYDTRLAAYAVIKDRAGRVLLALWNEAETPKWTMPGGGVELHETVEEAVVREVREETGFDIIVGARCWACTPSCFHRTCGSTRPTDT